MTARPPGSTDAGAVEHLPRYAEVPEERQAKLDDPHCARTCVMPPPRSAQSVLLGSRRSPMEELRQAGEAIKNRTLRHLDT